MKRVVSVVLAAWLTACGGGPSTTAPDTGESPAPTAFVRDCSWLTHEDPELMNIFFPDTQAHYWLGVFAIPPGGELRVEGEFPHARYMSFNLYDPTLAPFDGLNDLEIQPDAGAVNPFLPGARRDADARRYTLRIVAEPAPEDPAQRAPNTLYAGIEGIPVPGGVIMYRVYVPDRDASLAGNVDLPDFRYFLPGGVELPVPDACAFLEQTRLGLGLNAQLASMNLSAAPIPLSPTDPLDWMRFHNPLLTVIERTGPVIGDLPIYDALRGIALDSGLQGGFMSNRDNSYIAAAINNSAGELLVFGAQAPTTPATYERVPVMAPAQLRYLSICTVDFPTQRYWDCVYDEQLRRDAQDRYLVVVSHADQRPANARPECGVTWLNWGPLSAAAVILRNMLPATDFAQAVQNIHALDTEREVMGSYYPYGTYSSRAEFEALSLDPAGDADTCRVDAAALLQRAQG
jgi:hypothetical protein